MCCGHIVYAAMSCIPSFIREFVNFDAETSSFLWNVLPEDNSALEFYHYLVHCEMLQGVIEFSISLLQFVKDRPYFP